MDKNTIYNIYVRNHETLNYTRMGGSDSREGTIDAASTLARKYDVVKVEREADAMKINIATWFNHRRLY